VPRRGRRAGQDTVLPRRPARGSTTDRATRRGSDLHHPATFDHIFTLGLGKPQAEMLAVSGKTGDHWPVRVVIPAADLAAARPLVPLE